MFNSAKVYLFPILFVCPEMVKALLSTSKTAAFNSELQPKSTKEMQSSLKNTYFNIFINAMILF